MQPTLPQAARASGAFPRDGGSAGAALYLGLVSSEKVELGGADGDVGSTREDEAVVIGVAIAVGAVARAVPVIGVT